MARSSRPSPMRGGDGRRDPTGSSSSSTARSSPGGRRGHRRALWQGPMADAATPTLPADAVELPATLRHAVRVEFGRAFHAPYEVPIVIAVNGLLMTGLWFLLPPHWKDALFSLHGTLAFAMVLAAWMLSDVPATNLLGPDARRVVAALDDP